MAAQVVANTSSAEVVVPSRAVSSGSQEAGFKADMEAAMKRKLRNFGLGELVSHPLWVSMLDVVVTAISDKVNT